jgi:hypothetical protein
MDPTDGCRPRSFRRGCAVWAAAIAVAGLMGASQAAAGEPLRATDVPPGWVTIDAPPARLYAGLCGLRPRPKARTVLHARYAHPAGLPAVDSTWYEFATVALARKRLGAIRRALRTCRVYDFPLVSGEPAVITVEPLVEPALGDEAVAYVREVFLTDVTPGLRSAVIREGRRLASVHILDVVLPASEVADGLAALAAARA